MTFLIPHLKGLLFDCLSFIGGLITCLSTVDSEAPAVNFENICYKKWLFYVMMTTEMLIKYFCNIKLCCLW
jgi:hypothetical protein